MTTAQKRLLLLGLIAPFMMSVMNLSMFRLAIPKIRMLFGIPADSTAWLATAYSLSYMVFMPLYGLLGDRLTKRSLFFAGIAIFFGGTFLIQLSSSLALLVLGRIIQGAGVSGISPLCIAVISSRFPKEERGTALGQWNSFGTITAMVGPFLAGFVIDHFGWRAIYGPVVLLGVASLFFVWKFVPSEKPSAEGQEKKAAPPLDFDWIGFLLFGLFLLLIVFYISSRPITGIDPFADWRLGLGAAVSLLLLILWERRSSHPIIPFDLLRFGDFLPASLCSAIRMVLLGSFSLLVPLYLTEIYGMSAAWIGSVLAGSYVFFFFAMRIGGRLADRWGSRWFVVAGVCAQGGALVCLALLGDSISSWYVLPGLVLSAAGAGIQLAALHRAAMARIPSERSGAGAGLYSSIRFSGVMFGPALSGVLLENSLLKFTHTLAAYQRTFWIVAAVAGVGLLIALQIKD